VRSIADWTVALLVGAIGAWWNLGVAVLIGLVLAGAIALYRRGQDYQSMADHTDHTDHTV